MLIHVNSEISNIPMLVEKSKNHTSVLSNQDCDFVG